MLFVTEYVIECQLAKYQIKAEIRIRHGNQKKKKVFQETLQLSSKFIFFAIDHVYENNSFNASTMVTI